MNNCKTISNSVNQCNLLIFYILFIQGDQEVSVHLMITIQKSGAQRLFDHPV